MNNRISRSEIKQSKATAGKAGGIRGEGSLNKITTFQKSTTGKVNSKKIDKTFNNVFSEKSFYCYNILNNFLDIVILVDSSERIKFVNKKTSVFLHLPLERILNKKIGSLFGKTFRKNYLTEFEKRLTAVPEVFLHKHGNKKKQPIFLEFSLQKIVVEKERYALLVAKDITLKKRIIEEFAEREERYRQATENSPTPIFSVDQHGNILNWNKACEKTFGYSKDKIIGRSINNILCKKNNQRKFVNDQIKKVFKNQSVNDIEIIFNCTKDHQTITSSRIYPIRSKSKIISCIFANIDITEKKEKDIELQNRELKLMSIFKVAPVGIGVTINRVLKEVNDYICNLVGYERRELIEKSARKLYLSKAEYDRIGREKYSQIRKHGIGIVETKWKTKSGRILEILLSSSMIDPNDIKKGVTFTVLDITERKKNDDELRKYKRAVEQSPETILITDTKGMIEYVNPKFTELTGYSFKEVYGKSPKILSTNMRSKNDEKILWETLLSGNEWRGEFYNKKKNGEMFWQNASISPIKNDHGKITHFISVQEDITDRKKIVNELILAKEEAEKAGLLKSQFLAQMSHEIRSPLNVILNFTSLIQNEIAEKLTPEFSESFDSIQIAGRRIIRTIDLILNMSELQTGNYETVYRYVNLRIDILNPLERQYKLFAEAKGLSFNFIYNTHRIITYADEYSLGQIFANLIDNAIKYTNRGSVDVIVDMNEYEKLTVKVKDTGVGISEKYIPSLFNPFSQEEQGYTRSYEGNGLGLALVKRYCDLNKAEIYLDSTKGKGTTFTIILDMQ